MNVVPRKAVVSLCLCFFSFSAFAQTDLIYSSMSWIEGAWITEDSSAVEMWQYTGFGFAGVVNKVEDIDSYFENWEKLEVLESLALENSDGKWIYKALTREHKWQPVEFIQASSNKDEMGFYNATNDFPKWIIYKQINKDSLLVTIKNDEKSKEFHYNKIAPPGADINE